MSAHVVVIAADLRRATVKVSPATFLVDVLQEACSKLGLASDKFLLRHRQKQVDLAVPFRTSGLLSGAKLELVQKSKTPSAVQVALQTPPPDAGDVPGGRLIHKFPSDLPLWKVLRQFESGDAGSGRRLNITARGVPGGPGASGSGSGQLYYEAPVLNIMGRELSTTADLQKTLSQLGHNSGNVLIRLSYRKTDQTLVEAMEQISSFFDESEDQGDDDKAAGSKAEERSADSEATGQPPDTPMADADAATQPPDGAAPAQEQSPDAGSPAAEPPSQEATLDGDASGAEDPYQPVGVFLAPAGDTPAAALVPADDADFAPSIAHAQQHQARLQESSRNKRLPSDKELADRAAADEARIAAIHSVLVKVRFPDNTSSDWRVGPQDTGAFLYRAVRSVMARPDLPFHLVLPGGRPVIRDDPGPAHSLIRAYKLSGRVLVSLVWDDAVPADVRRQPFLRAHVAQRGQAIQVPEVPEADEGSTAVPPGPAAPAADRSEAREGGGKKIPKWLKLGKK